MANSEALDQQAWFFGELSRKEADERLLGQEPGLYLVRNSNTSRGDFVLSVSENNKVSHHIIELRDNQYHIGELHFQTLPAVIEFYKVHYLDTTVLTRPCSKTVVTSQFQPPPEQPLMSPPAHQPSVKSDQPSMTYIVKYTFTGGDDEDLPCKKGEILVLVQKEEDNWWKMKNEKGNVGLVPKPYIEQVTQSCSSQYRAISAEPVVATAVQARIPTPYDYTQLKLDVGDLVRVIQRNTSGQWEGEVVGTGRKGSFPFRCVRILEGQEREEALQRLPAANGPSSREET